MNSGLMCGLLSTPESMIDLYSDASTNCWPNIWMMFFAPSSPDGCSWRWAGLLRRFELSWIRRVRLPASSSSWVRVSIRSISPSSRFTSAKSAAASGVTPFGWRPSISAAFS
jgi:hypothetical protein